MDTSRTGAGGRCQTRGADTHELQLPPGGALERRFERPKSDEGIKSSTHGHLRKNPDIDDLRRSTCLIELSRYRPGFLSTARYVSSPVDINTFLSIGALVGRADHRPGTRGGNHARHPEEFEQENVQ